ncbi:chaperonin 10-like protein [Aspergillus foveolatus]|uniref:chaperonin 10-like protein n=1 Tax=Aspergillus foveolatus TaxID=210207 RepID=UPI003CCD2C79
MPTNNAAVWVSHRTLAIQDRPITPPGPNEVLVQVISTGICGSDAHNWNNPNSAGLIVEFGSEVKDRHVGQRVAVEPGFACATCEFCLRGNPNTCANLKYCGLDPTDGTLQQYFTCKAHMAIPIPEEISWKKRAQSSLLDCVVGDNGCGPLGLLVIAIAKAYGVCKIVVFDIEQSRLDFALSYGADIGVLSPKISETEHNLSHGVDISVEASGAESSAQMALTILKPGRTCIQAGLGKRLTNVPLFLLTANELTLKGTVRFTPGCYQEAIELVKSKRVDLKPLITETFPLTRAQGAFHAQFERRGVKIVIFNPE